MLGALVLGVLLSAGETNPGIRGACKVLSAREERKRDGPVDRKVFFAVTTGATQAVATVECDHRAIGASDWLIRVGTTDSGEAKADRCLLAGAVLLAVDRLGRDYPTDPVGEVCLDPADMPAWFSAALYKEVAADMRRLHSKAKRFDDPKVRKMVRNAYRKMSFVRYLRGCLEEEGFSVKVDTAELCCLQRTLEGVRWKTIAGWPAVGLNVQSATCCLELQRVDAFRKR
jgi:hypothetical protein